MSNALVIDRIRTNKKVIALTFDIAYGHRVPLRMLKVLRRCGVQKAAFFITGAWADLNPSIAKQIRKQGYEIASHGNQHQDYRKHANGWIEKEVITARQIIKRTTGVHTNLFRPPGGDMNERVIRKLKAMNQTIVYWDVDSLDWKQTDVNKITERVMSQVRSGSIILLHACDPWYQSLSAVPILVKELRKKGYRFATVNELLRGQIRRNTFGVKR
ncbi:polysaccharide deacetylase family protein [Paenibacillus alvei]|uniref:Peptidoglycan/xylan/chitin deacetylase, PgdA/CDA1 family n=1 Tax=Paenibacillus alvei TaxID=44250 RepID=A0A383RE06_PAEAL|nr:polysaccharide deacetylase family protein [Paenibacillus alvei]SYX85315.1 Peptidoglycan/xylan/chitin deacetylase, PgdA/CDA1 family [Paenibacillus alvei]